MRCGKVFILVILALPLLSQPARMRCGKVYFSLPLSVSVTVATRTNALWQRAIYPHVDKNVDVATRTNALWQRCHACICLYRYPVATRTNALWQSCLQAAETALPASQPARMRCGKECVSRCCRGESSRNPHECAVAKKCGDSCIDAGQRRNPHECAVAKKGHVPNARVSNVATRTNALWQRLPSFLLLSFLSSQPARMRCGKVNLRGFKRLHEYVATRTNALWQRRSAIPLLSD